MGKRLHRYDEQYAWGDEPVRDPNKPAPFSHSRLYGGEKYSLQDMLLNSFGATVRLPEGVQCHSVWDDRAYAAWRESSQGIKSKDSGDAFWNGVSQPSLKAFVEKMAVHTQVRGEVVGARIVRYTNVSSGYPTNRLDILYKPTT